MSGREPPAAQAADQPPAVVHGARVLVVEDEQPLRRAFTLNLQQRGYQVDDAADLDGVLARQGRPRPALAAVSAAAPVPSRLAEFCPAAFLPKPFPISALIRAVERAAANKDCSNEYPHHSAV